MAPSKRPGKAKTRDDPASSASSPASSSSTAPFKHPPDVFQPLINELDPKHVYITHIDGKSASFKRKIFLVPIGMNIFIAAMFIWRMYAIIPWYWKLVVLAFGHHNDLAFPAHQATWTDAGWEVGKRAGIMFIDFLLFVFVWPWPAEFTLGWIHGNPTQWRMAVGFRDKEIYVRRSRDWDMLLKDVFEDANSRKILFAYIREATAPLLQEQKTGYLLMNGAWDLDWKTMVKAHAMVDKKDIALDAFRSVVFFHHQAHGWLSLDTKVNGVASIDEDSKRRQVFAFRDALSAMGKEDLFYRWVEVVQFEATQPGGFGPDKQEAAAKKIRDLFEEQNVDFDELWEEATGTAAPPTT